MSEKRKNGINIFKITPSTVRKSMNLCLAQRGVNKGKRTEKSTCLNYFSKNIFRLYVNILIDLSSESERNSVFKLIAE